MTIDGKSYSAFHIAGTTWMIRRFQQSDGTDDESNYVECEISVDTDDPEVATKAAIAADSWA